jgi:hypothetical protein
LPHSEAFCLQHSDLNGFLQAHIGTERHGGSLSVLSAIARLGEDPWNEAGRLASLPKAAATADLARIIANMPSSLWPLPEAEIIAARLTALLPDGAGRKAALGRPKLERSAIVLIVLAAGGALAFNILLGSFIHPTSPAGTAPIATLSLSQPEAPEIPGVR